MFNTDNIRGVIDYRRTPIEIESPENFGYANIKFNLAESSVPDIPFKDIKTDFNNVVLAYGDHLGLESLRQKLAKEVGEPISKNNVITTVGAAGALFIVATSLLCPGDHVIVLHPNYVTNIETPRAIGCDIDYIRLKFEDQYQINIDKLKTLMRPETRYISITYPHNPTGVMIEETQLREIISIAEENQCILLSDETYGAMTFNARLPHAAKLSPQAISIASFSKSYGMPGIRLGYLITQREALIEKFLAAKEQIFIGTSLLDEHVGDYFIAHKEVYFSQIKNHIETNFAILKEWMSESRYLEWIEPEGGCVCFPRIRPEIELDIDAFYSRLNAAYKTFVGPGHWFEMDRRSMRIGYAWPAAEELSGGLRNINMALADVL